MERVIVTVKREGEARVRDLEVPAQVEAQRLVDLIAAALRWQTDPAGQRLAYQIEAQPLGRRLAPTETLEDAGVWDGSWLVLHPVEAPEGVPRVKRATQGTQPATPMAPSAGSEALVSWHALPVEQDKHPEARPPVSGSANNEPSKKEKGYNWKQID